MKSSTAEVSSKEVIYLRDLFTIVIVLGCVSLMWEILVYITKIPPYLLPAPSNILRTFLAQPVYFLYASLITLGEAVAGLGLGMAVGILTAVFITLWHRLERGVLILAILIKATPMVAIAPLLTIWFGFTAIPKIIITGLMTFFPVLINVHVGLHAVDPSILALFHSLDASPSEILREARWPPAMRYLFASLKVVGPLAFVGAVVAEWAGASAGLGRVMWLAYANMNMPILFAAILCSAVMGICIFLALTTLEKRIIFW